MVVEIKSLKLSVCQDTATSAVSVSTLVQLFSDTLKLAVQSHLLNRGREPGVPFTFQGMWLLKLDIQDTNPLLLQTVTQEPKLLSF